MNDTLRKPITVADIFDSYGSEIISAGGSIDVDKLATLLGIKVVRDYSLEDEDIVGQICFENDVPVVKINPIQNSYNPRRRFTLAHEIGHYCLHSLDSKKGFTDSRRSMSRSESYWDKYESEANAFAAELLIPIALVPQRGADIINRYKAENSTEGMPVNVFIERMADVFDVSSKAMQYRLASLGIAK